MNPALRKVMNRDAARLKKEVCVWLAAGGSLQFFYRILKAKKFVNQPEIKTMTAPSDASEKRTRTITVMNRASLAYYAMLVSQQRRSGKFTRVGTSFIERCEARLEAVIRQINPNRGAESELVSLPEGHTNFITSTAREKAEEMLESVARRIIHAEVLRHPSVGVTLQ